MLNFWRQIQKLKKKFFAQKGGKFKNARQKVYKKKWISIRSVTGRFMQTHLRHPEPARQLEWEEAGAEGVRVQHNIFQGQVQACAAAIQPTAPVNVKAQPNLLQDRILFFISKKKIY